MTKTETTPQKNKIRPLPLLWRGLGRGLNWLRLQRIRFQMRPAKLKKAIKQADRLHKETGKRYRVFFFGNKYHVWNRQDIREKQHSGLLKWKKVGEDFDRICFYDTNPGQATSKSLNKKGGARCFF